MSLEKEIKNFLIEKYKEEPIKIIKENEYLYLYLFKYDEPTNPLGNCIYCGRPTRTKNNSGQYICNKNRKIKCGYINICPKCGKIFKAQKPTKGTPFCSHKCSYNVTLKVWHEENAEKSHELAVKMGKKNGGVAFKKAWDENREEMIKICSKGGKIGGKITAKLGYWKENGNLDTSKFFDKEHPLYYSEKWVSYRKHFIEVASYNGGKSAGKIAVETGQINDLFTRESIDKREKKKKENGFYEGINKFDKDIECNIKCRFYLECKKKNLHILKNKWGYCFDIYHFGQFGAISREEFYKSSLSLVRLEKDKCIKLSDIDVYNGISGVWAIWDSIGCVDVCSTIDIGKEMKLALRRKRNLNDTKINTDNKRWKEKYEDWHGDVTFKIVKSNIDGKIERELIEAQYAHDNKARHWYPAPGQSVKNC